MLNLNQMMAAQKYGGDLINSLVQDEMTILQNYCLMSAQALITSGATQKRGVTDITLNAFRNGMAFGLATAVQQGVLKERQKQ